MSQASATTPLSPADQLIRQLYGLGHVRRELAKASGRASTPSFGALAALHTRGAIRVSELAAALQVDLSVASRQVGLLVDAGHVDRVPDPADGRAHLLQLTAAGSDALTAAHHEMVAVLTGALADWEPAEVEALSAGLERLATSFSPVPPNQEIAR